MNILLIPAELIDPVDQLSQTTLWRLIRGYALWSSGNFDMILVTGGTFLSSDRQTRPAADIMYDWLTQNGEGLAAEHILVERTSLDTYENISHALQQLEDRNILLPSITVVSQPRHARRFEITFRQAHGMEISVQHARLAKPANPIQWALEWLMIAYHRYDADGSGFVARMNRANRAAAAAR